MMRASVRIGVAGRQRDPPESERQRERQQAVIGEGHPDDSESEEACGGCDANDRPSASEWPYELRFYDPPPEGLRVTLRSSGAAPGRIALADYTVGLDDLPGAVPRPPNVERSPDHSADLMVVRRTFAG
jgi:hypothetical protein